MSPVGYLGRPCMWGGAEPCPPASWLGVWAPGEWLWGKSSKDRVPLGRRNSKDMCRAETAWGVRRDVCSQTAGPRWPRAEAALWEPSALCNPICLDQPQ